MKLLALECSAAPASVAITDNGKLLAEFYCNVGLTHSQTLMPMVEAALVSCGLSIDDIEGLCISNGPGSFTGIRIGISALKGMAIAKNLPCVGVSTLNAMAYSNISFNGIIVSCMDARCKQCYCALFLSDTQKITRISDDMALSMEELCGKIISESAKYDKKAVIVGDGAELFMSVYGKDIPGVQLANANCRFQAARYVAFFSEPQFLNGKTDFSDNIFPEYLRLPQAERELKKKRDANK